ncbi:MAG TPA: hypothetical protein VKV23_10850 [Acidimicrobiales bacterium]|nr:hypothetical protein [Acidimicrobiales bacterium]
MIKKRSTEALSNDWQLRIAHAFSSHVREETHVLDAYELVAQTTGDEGTRYLLRLILDDERRHHEIFEQLSASLDRGEAPRIPDPPNPAPADRPALSAQTRRLLELERSDERSLRELARELRPAERATLWRLLVDLMELDTTKHIRILEYLQERLDALG